MRIARESGLPVILSGGISSDDDIRMVCAEAADSGISGIIIGKAVYEGRINLEKIIQENNLAPDEKMEW
jgi:phosphoribosylformimino-5-aminoimidazole carboxamide ribotide isomerase